MQYDYQHSNNDEVCSVVRKIIDDFFDLMNSFYARGRVLVKSHSFCRTWQIIDYTFTSSIIWCKAILTVERHILVFYPIYLRSHRQQIILHHIPLILINLYLFLFYIFIHIFCPWKYNSNFNRHLCGDQCLDQSDGVSTFNWLFNILFPAFIIIFGSMGLLIRVLWTRREMQRNLRNWSKNWKMIIQLLGIAVIYSVIWLPVSVISLITMFSKTDRSTETIADHFYYLTYLCEMTLPIISLYFWPELMQRLRGGLRPTSIAPITVGVHSTN